VDAVGAPHMGERSEGQLIRDFVERIGQLRPQLITFNGHSFDLPVLRYRAMVNRIPAMVYRCASTFTATPRTRSICATCWAPTCLAQG
jgi:predicted PolB exonuclease-like 3'-5' exonuclease